MEKKYTEQLARYSNQLPNLLGSFTAAAEIAPRERVEWAKKFRSKIYRDGWFINTPTGEKGDGETVDQHVTHLKDLINTYLPEKYRAMALEYAECHDDHETIAHAVIKGIARDLNPRFNTQHYQISEDDKEFIEDLAIELLYEADPKSKSLHHKRKDPNDMAANLFGGLDKLCVMWRCVEYVESGKYKYPDFQAYWDYWTLEKAQSKTPKFISDIYREHLLPRTQELQLL